MRRVDSSWCSPDTATNHVGGPNHQAPNSGGNRLPESPNSLRARHEMTSFFCSVSTSSPQVTGTSASQYSCTECTAELLEEMDSDRPHKTQQQLSRALLTLHDSMRAQESTFIAISRSRNTEARFLKKYNAYTITGFAKE